MPFADHRRGVARFAEEFWEGLLGPVELVSVYQKAIGMGILAGLNGGPHWPADRVGHVALLKEHAVAGERIDVRGRAVFLEPGVVSADRLIGMVVGEDEQNVRAFRRTQGKSGRGKDQGKKFHPYETTVRALVNQVL